MKPRLRLFDPWYPPEVRAIISSRLEEGRVFEGDLVAELEAEIAERMGVEEKQVVAVSSCTEALHLAMAATPHQGFEVLVPGLTMAATAHAVRMAGNEPRFVDVGPDMLVSAEICEAAWRERVGAILAVDYAGFLPDYQALQEVAHRHEALVIEDAAHSFGTDMYGHRAGELADVACFSLYPTKPLQGLGGGVIVNNIADQPRLHSIPRERRYYGIRDRKGCDYDIARLGGNYYMSDLSAAAALWFLRTGRYRKDAQWRSTLAREYAALLALGQMPFQVKAPRYIETCAYHLYPVVLPAEVDRDQLQAHMLAQGVETGTHYKPVHWMSLYQVAPRGAMPYLDGAGKSILTLPCHRNMDVKDVLTVVEALASFAPKT